MQLLKSTISEFGGRITMVKLCSFVLIASLFLTSSAFGQEINRVQLQQVTKVEPARASFLLPPGQQAAAAPATAPAAATKPASTGTSHKKRNIIIAVVVGAVVAGVIVAASNSGGSGY
jgi:hypothetical protein